MIRRKSLSDLIANPKKLVSFFNYLNDRFNGVLFKDSNKELTQGQSDILSKLFDPEGVNQNEIKNLFSDTKFEVEFKYEVFGDGNATNVAVLSKNLTDIFSVASGGGATNTYSGMNMVDTHDPAKNPRMGKKVNDAEMTKFIGYVGQAAGKNGVTDPVIIDEVVALLESLRAPIVQE